jgi:hypothetical protein
MGVLTQGSLHETVSPSGSSLACASVRECPLKALAAMSPGTTNDPRDRIRRSVGGLECLDLWPNESSRCEN